jgi:hypothetical protein
MASSATRSSAVNAIQWASFEAVVSNTNGRLR